MSTLEYSLNKKIKYSQKLFKFLIKFAKKKLEKFNIIGNNCIALPVNKRRKSVIEQTRKICFSFTLGVYVNILLG